MRMTAHWGTVQHGNGGIPQKPLIANVNFASIREEHGLVIPSTALTGWNPVPLEIWGIPRRWANMPTAER